MPSMREKALSALFDRLQLIAGGTVKRNEALPSSVPAGLVILRDSDPGDPDVTLNPRTEFYSHRAEIETFVTQPTRGAGEAVLRSARRWRVIAASADWPKTCSGVRSRPRSLPSKEPYLVSDPLAA